MELRKEGFAVGMPSAKDDGLRMKEKKQRAKRRRETW